MGIYVDHKIVPDLIAGTNEHLYNLHYCVAIFLKGFFSAVSVCICEAHNLCPLYVQFLTLSKEVLHFAVLFLRRGQWC